MSLVGVSNTNASELIATKSYAVQQTGGGGQVPIVNEKMANVVNFYDDGTVQLLMGTVWRRQGTDRFGNFVYAFVRDEGIPMPGVYYQNMVMAPDCSRFQINYVFSIMGRGCSMYKLYQYLGEGSEMARQWISGGY